MFYSLKYRNEEKTFYEISHVSLTAWNITFIYETFEWTYGTNTLYFFKENLLGSTVLSAKARSSAKNSLPVTPIF